MPPSGRFGPASRGTERLKAAGSRARRSERRIVHGQGRDARCGTASLAGRPAPARRPSRPPDKAPSLHRPSLFRRRRQTNRVKTSPASPRPRSQAAIGSPPGRPRRGTSGPRAPPRGRLPPRRGELQISRGALQHPCDPLQTGAGVLQMGRGARPLRGDLQQISRVSQHPSRGEILPPRGERRACAGERLRPRRGLQPPPGRRYPLPWLQHRSGGWSRPLRPRSLPCPGG